MRTAYSKTLNFKEVLGTNFLDLFPPIAFPKYENEIYFHTSDNSVDKVLVGFYPYEAEDLDELTTKINTDCCCVILSNAINRNIVVYDSLSNPEEFSIRLIALLSTVMRRNLGRLTDIFLRSPYDDGGEKTDFIAVNRVKIHYLRNEVWDAVEHNYKLMGGNLAEGDDNLVIGVNQNNKEEFFRVVKEEISFTDNKINQAYQYGVALLNSNNVILGSY